MHRPTYKNIHGTEIYLHVYNVWLMQDIRHAADHESPEVISLFINISYSM